MRPSSAFLRAIFAAALGLATLGTGSARAQVYEKVFIFADVRPTNDDNFLGNGRAPISLVQGRDGDFYGTAERGGINLKGVVFKMTPEGIFTTLVNFTGNGSANRGEDPAGGLVQGGDGDFYGTTRSGGASGRGTVFRMTPAGQLTTLVEFTGNGTNNKGSEPVARLVQATDGNFYGTTIYGGTNDLGTVFRMTPAGVLTTLVNFTDNGAINKGALPDAGLVQGSDGALYGTTEQGARMDWARSLG